MILYVTFNDSPSGIYSSQVIDVVNYLSEEFNDDIKLLAFISLRNFFENKAKIKRGLTSAIVLPMFPSMKLWKWNVISLKMLSWFMKADAIIGRSVMATNLALSCRIKKVIYDGRGAISAEWNEYKVVNNRVLESEIYNLEKRAVLESQYRIAVSNKLVAYWQEKFNYQSKNHVIIPCTINSIFLNIDISKPDSENLRQQFDWKDEDVILVYSGSQAGWQSFELMDGLARSMVKESSNLKLLFLCDTNEHIQKLIHAFPKQIACKKVQEQMVPHYLSMCDYGILIREKSITNQVASPVKFAEYLACGLNVIISENLGDYTEFVEEHHVGFVYNKDKLKNLLPLNNLNRMQNKVLAKKCFSKDCFKEEYEKLIKIIHE